MIQVDIRGEQGNAFWLLGYARNLAKQLQDGNDSYDPTKITEEMKSGDYHHLLATFEPYFGEYVELIGKEEV